MRYKSIFTIAFMMIVVSTNTSAEIFEEVHDYDPDACDIESADFNNDGLDDFAITEWITDSSYYEVFLSNGDCSFTRPGSVFVDTSNIGQLLTGDFNEDSNEDMVLMSLDNTWMYLGDGTGGFTLEEVFPWSYCNGCVEDINNDDHLDLVGIPIDSWTWFEAHGNSVIVMLGDGEGDFTYGWGYYEYPPVEEGYCSCQLAYFDNLATDSILDMCVPSYEGFLVFQGVGDGTFFDPEYYVPVLGAYQLYCACDDFNEDGYNDIAVAGDAGMNQYSTFVFLNQQDGTFLQEGEGYFGGACGIEKIAAADLDLDGNLDLSVEGSIAGYGDGTFNGDWYEYLSYKTGGNYIFMDMDLDGDLDLAGYWGGIYRNTTINLGIEGHESGSITDPVLDVSPNPFSSFVSIEVSGYSDGSGNLQIFDVSGRLVAELEPDFSNGEAVYHWNGVSSSGVELPSGIYTARLFEGNVAATAELLKLE